MTEVSAGAPDVPAVLYRVEEAASEITRILHTDPLLQHALIPVPGSRMASDDR